MRYSKTGYIYKELEGVSIYFESNAAIFTFVPLDDQGKSEYVRFEMWELENVIDFQFEIPAS